MPSATIEAPTPSANPTSDVAWKVVDPPERRLDRRELELDAETDLVCLGEPGRRGTHRLRPEPCQRFEGHDPAVGQIEHGLELDVDVVTLEHVAHARPLELALLAFELTAIDLIRD